MIAESEERLVHIPAGSVLLEGNLGLPEGARGIVLFAHGSGSSRFSPRNRYVAQLLNQARLATLLVDLLNPEEQAVDLRTAQLHFDICLLAKRLTSATDWLVQQPDTPPLPIEYFGASTGAAAALVAAAERPGIVRAVVSRGGRPDLAGAALAHVETPTLLIVGGNDPLVIELNRVALARLRCETQLVIVPGATHLFEEPGALDVVAMKVVHPGKASQAVGCKAHVHDWRISRMNVHKNARLTPAGRLLLMQRIEVHGWEVSDAATRPGSRCGGATAGWHAIGPAVSRRWPTAARRRTVASIGLMPNGSARSSACGGSA